MLAAKHVLCSDLADGCKEQCLEALDEDGRECLLLPDSQHLPHHLLDGGLRSLEHRRITLKCPKHPLGSLVAQHCEPPPIAL